MRSRFNYHGLPITEARQFDTELVRPIISTLKLGNACGSDRLSAEHLKYCHPCLPYVLVKLFQLMLFSSYIPAEFRYSYIVPFPKLKECYSKSLTCENFRGIAISRIL